MFCNFGEELGVLGYFFGNQLYGSPHVAKPCKHLINIKMNISKFKISNKLLLSCHSCTYLGITFYSNLKGVLFFSFQNAVKIILIPFSKYFKLYINLTTGKHKK